MTPRLTGTTVGLALGITIAAGAASAAGAYLYSIRHSDALLETARRGALARSELIRAALEHAMLEDDHSLVAGMLATFGRDSDVVNVVLLDRAGKVRVAAHPLARDDSLRPGSPTCQACHQYPPAQRTTSRVIDVAGTRILRTVLPIHNRPACRECHDPRHAINGVLIADTDTSAIHAVASRDLRWMVGVTALLTLLLVATIGLLVRLVVLRRLQRFETAARQIAQGDLTRRVAESGSDTIAWLAREFNTMADSVGSLVSQVQSERERLEVIINSIEDGIVVLDTERRVVAANNAFLARTGTSRSELLGCACHREGSSPCTVSDCPALACLRVTAPQIRICERRRADGTIAWEEVQASPVANLPGGDVHVVEVWRDISERRAAEARMAESHKLASLGLLASGFSHELNTPLGTVLACVEGIGRETAAGSGPPDWAYVRDTAMTARDQVLRCRGITQQFLRMSRGAPSTPLLVDVKESVAAAVRLVEPTARGRGVTLRLALDATSASLRVMADEADLQHAVINLLLNAVQASPADRVVHVGIDAPTGALVTVAITDTGSGIAPEHLSRLFEPFFSLRPGGTGLGLFMSMTAVRRWGGDITVRSQPGTGSTFAITLPLVDDAVASIPA